MENHTQEHLQLTLVKIVQLDEICQVKFVQKVNLLYTGLVLIVISNILGILTQ